MLTIGVLPLSLASCLGQEVVVIALAAPPGELDTLTLPETVVHTNMVLLGYMFGITDKL